MSLTFKNEHIIPDLKSATGLEAIGELVNHLVSVGTVSSETSDSIVHAIFPRPGHVITLNSQLGGFRLHPFQ